MGKYLWLNLGVICSIVFLLALKCYNVRNYTLLQIDWTDRPFRHLKDFPIKVFPTKVLTGNDKSQRSKCADVTIHSTQILLLSAVPLCQIMEFMNDIISKCITFQQNQFIFHRTNGMTHRNKQQEKIAVILREPLLMEYICRISLWCH